ncbi:uncharacterized protein NPIL_223371 [Nephila pilipes]|uniref:Uncharacterized protein n=1 Tax=Nephila pilipes TaxID=299642 RepID=A0A8X6MIX7_NEPPI|nr:uncharacterized protein NPIL_223371 [Nephila pilipes]
MADPEEKITNKNSEMNEKEKKGVAELLGEMSVQDLIDIANLTTNHLAKYDDGVKPSVVINDIIENASTSSEILHRQKVLKDILYKYLKKNGVAVKAKGRRQDYIRSCLALWGSTDHLKMQNDENTRQTRSFSGKTNNI